MDNKTKRKITRINGEFDVTYIRTYSAALAIAISLTISTLPVYGLEYTFNMFGNANLDETIDEADVGYVQGVIQGTKDETELSDANYDGVVNEDDVAQIEAIIAGEETELTYLDFTGRVVTVKKPVERIVMLGVGEQAEALRILDSMDKVVGVGEHFFNRDYTKALFPEFKDLPNVGAWDNYEAILSQNPDSVVVYSWYNPADSEMENNLPGVTILRFDFYRGGIMLDEMKKFGYVLDRREQAQDYIDFFEEYVGGIYERVKDLPEEERPSVYQESATVPYKTFNAEGGATYQIEMAGGRSISSGLTGLATGAVEVDPEWVVSQNPGFIIKMAGWGSSGGGYAEGNSSGLEELRTEIMNREGLKFTDAVVEGKVYVISYDVLYPPCMPASIAYMAKWFHPDLFEDIDPREIHQEYLDKFHENLGWNVYESGVFVYPIIESA